MNNNVQHVFLIGAKSLGSYGGYETFVKKLVEHHQNVPSIKYHIACKANGEGAMDERVLQGASVLRHRKDGTAAEFDYCNARCFKVPVPNIGAAQAIFYDFVSLWNCCKYIEEHHIAHPVIYIMACRIGPLMPYFYRRIHSLGGKIYLNPDGHEWKRGKWNQLVRKYWKISERLMVRFSDCVVCDSANIEKYIHKNYDGKGLVHSDPKTTYISYGANVYENDGASPDAELMQWYRKNNLMPGEYYLMVGRLVKENNFETVIREYMASDSDRPLVIIATQNDKYMHQLEEAVHFQRDPRVRFAGTVYNENLLAGIRKNAYAYLHGHEVGGTNPSLLEALGATKLNLLLDVPFNREVAEDGALYWTKQTGSLAALLHHCDSMTEESISCYEKIAKHRIISKYSWQHIADQFEELFCEEVRAHVGV